MDNQLEPQRYFEGGMDAFKQDNLDVAISHFKRCVELNPEYTEGHLYLGKAFAKKADYYDARDAYDVACKLEPDNKNIHIEYGDLLMVMGEPQRAQKHYAKAISLEKDNPDLHVRLGFSLMQQEKLDPALNEINNAIALDIGNADAHCYRGDVLHAKGFNFHVEALRSYDKAIGAKPNHVRAIHNRAVAVALKKAHDAEEELTSRINKKLTGHTENLSEQEEKFEREMLKSLKEFQEKVYKRIELDTTTFRNFAETHRKEAEAYNKKFFVGMYISLGILMGYAIFAYKSVWPEIQNENDPLLLISWLLIAAMVFAPVVGVLRTFEARRHEAYSLSFEFERKATLEERLAAYGPSNEDLKHKLLQKYVEHWMENSPVEVLATLRNKKRSKPILPSLLDRFAPGGDS